MLDFSKMCEIAGCEEPAVYWINKIGKACKDCTAEVLDDLKIDEEEIRRI
ncbi:hypothetical protein PM3016_5476 [Paenibacillus mucilaginosus 3016]|uniref:Uncharacterized protein n=1 Tax=Paenibacillus mucilaginosus 3016 TaxID=1116391 RepID=H6NG49_9BACL|nr:hypothetical protein PM3016_5476 [Paenibacillus mucilaginosus 3016]